jgi:UDP-glucose 4-epimerase
MNILITGGAGFIGSHLVDALLARNHQVFILDNLSTGKASNLNGGIFLQRDIIDSLTNIFDQHQFDYVFHLAAQINLRHSIQHPKNDSNTNIVGGLNILENCLRTKVKRIIFSSTGGAIYSPEASLPFSEETLVDPQSPYGLAKLTFERYLQMFKDIDGLPFTILRYSNVFGPRQDSQGEAGVISIFLERALKNQDLTIFGDGNQTRDFIYVQDVVRANLIALDQQLDGIFNVCTNTQCSINQITQKILQLTNSSSKVIYTNPIAGEMLHARLSFNKLKEYGWQPQWTLDEGLQTTINDFK